jgi:hypothetical protein
VKWLRLERNDPRLEAKLCRRISAKVQTGTDALTFSVSTLIVLVLVLTAIGVWNGGARVREIANRVAIDACQRRSLQFLDGTVALVKSRPRLDKAGLRIERTYIFDYAGDGGGRASGFIIMLNDDVQHVGLDDDAQH